MDTGKNKKVIGLMKDELHKKVETRFVGVAAKTYSYLIDDGSKDKKSKRYKKVLKSLSSGKLEFESWNCLEEK